MKNLSIILLFIGLSASAQTNLLILPPPGSIHLAWNYLASDLTNADGTAAELNFVVRASPSISSPISNWPVIYNASWTNTTVTNFDGSNFVFTIPFNVQPVGQCFFVATASNSIWGESPLSNTNWTPKVAVSPKTKITKD